MVSGQRKSSHAGVDNQRRVEARWHSSLTIHRFRDLLEAITGEWVGHSAVDTAWASRNPDGSWFLDGTMPIIEFKHQLGIEQALPDEDKDRYNTVAGLFLLISGKIPQRGDSVECVGWRLQVAEMIGHRIGRLRAYPVPSAPAK